MDLSVKSKPDDNDPMAIKEEPVDYDDVTNNNPQVNKKTKSPQPTSASHYMPSTHAPVTGYYSEEEMDTLGEGSQGDSREDAESPVDRCEVCGALFDDGLRARTNFHSNVHDFELYVCKICFTQIDSRQPQQAGSPRQPQQAYTEYEMKEEPTDEGYEPEPVSFVNAGPSRRVTAQPKKVTNPKKATKVPNHKSRPNRASKLHNASKGSKLGDVATAPDSTKSPKLTKLTKAAEPEEKYAWTVYGARLPEHIINAGKMLFDEDSPSLGDSQTQDPTPNTHLISDPHHYNPLWQLDKYVEKSQGDDADLDVSESGEDDCEEDIDDAPLYIKEDMDDDVNDDVSDDEKKEVVDLFDSSSQMDSGSGGTPSESGVQDKQHECHICSETCSNRRLLIAHIKTHTGVKKPHRCETCGKCFSRSSNLQSHKRTHTGDTNFECPICQKIFGHNSWLKRHLRTHTGEKQHKCEVCSKWVSSSTSLQSHMRTHTGERPYVCPTCHKGFSVKSTLTIHMRVHTGEKPFKCDVCHSYFAQGSQLRTHMRTHMTLLECDVCQREFVSAEALKNHSKVHNEDMIFQCKFCSMNFSSREGLKGHITGHIDDRTYVCEVCDKIFKRKDNLKEHMKVHTGERPHKCPVCQESFSNKSHVKVHLRTHTGEKPYTCNICRKTFTQSSSVKNHMRIHTGEKPYQCHICMDLFTRATSVKKHMSRAHPELIETLEGWVFRCPECGEDFPSEDELKAHVKSLHGEKQTFTCDVCQRECVSIQALKYHMRRHITDTEEDSASTSKVANGGEEAAITNLPMGSVANLTNLMAIPVPLPAMNPHLPSPMFMVAPGIPMVYPTGLVLAAPFTSTSNVGPSPTASTSAPLPKIKEET